ncbi:MAG: MerR family transcriptional regulator [Bifidobacteriaceae bacterium]|nr:MerR family transcriptional regulator [Bifidobacteriaceae bacterium]
MTMTIQGVRWYTISETARLTGLPESTLHYYESVGVLEPAHRDESSGHRVYGEHDIDSILTVSCLNATGMPLDDMRNYLQANRSGNPVPQVQISLLRDQQARLKEQEKQLKAQQKYLALKVRYWKASEAGDDAEALEIGSQAAALVSKMRGN